MVLVSIPENPVPSGAVAGFFTTRDGTKLRFARWRPTARRCQGTVCLIHGRTEFIEKYFETIGELRRRGFAVATFDWRGQGGSDRQVGNLHGHVRSFDLYARDLTQFVGEVVMPDCPAPYFALAHSMGADVTLMASRRRPPLFERLVLVAPMLEIGLRRVPPGLVKGAAGLARLLGLGRMPVGVVPRKAREDAAFEDSILTSDRARFSRNAAVLHAAPHLRTGQPTVAWLRAAYKAMDLLAREDFPHSLQSPLLMIAAGADRVVSTAAIERYSQRLRAGTHILVPGARHEIMMEQDRYREQFWAAFDAFVPGSDNPFAETMAATG